MLNNKSDFILEYNESKKNNLKRDDVDWSQSKIIFVSPSFNSYQKNSVNFKDVPFELWEIRKFSDNIVSFNQQLSSSKESIQMVEGSKNTVIKRVSSEVKVYDEEHHTNPITEKNKLLYKTIKEELMKMDEVEFVNTKNYIGFKKNNIIVSYINFFKNSLRFDVVKGNIKQDGSKSKGFFNLDDPKNLSKVIQIKFKSGVRREYYNIKVSNKDEIGYLIMLLKQKYDSL
jgi:predicted transport protein